MNTSRHSLDLSIVAFLALGLGLVIGLFLGYMTYSTPSYLSIRSTDPFFIGELFSEAKASGECVKVENVDSRYGMGDYWLHSCNP